LAINQVTKKVRKAKKLKKAMKILWPVTFDISTFRHLNYSLLPKVEIERSAQIKRARKRRSTPCFNCEMGDGNEWNEWIVSEWWLLVAAGGCWWLLEPVR
jgi:hypothetical protein